MQGNDVEVYYKGTVMAAGEALEDAGIIPFVPAAKEGLALTNGTSFMGSALAIGYLKEIHEFENILSMEGMFLNTVKAIDAAFYESIHSARKQKGQKLIAKMLSKHFENSPFIDREGIQNDYNIRCLPQILGPKIEQIMFLYDSVERELDAITDNPLIFRGDEISDDVAEGRIFTFNDEKWIVISGGNFHGEYIATISDVLAMLNAKIALTLERQLTYMLNPARNKNLLPTYLINNKEHVGLLSGFMITQYTANAVTQKICRAAMPVSNFNLTSANESEDVVSYGATGAQRLLEQLEHLHELNTIYLTTVAQAYSIAREEYSAEQLKGLLTEKMFATIQDNIGSEMQYPISEDLPFDKHYNAMSTILNDGVLRDMTEFPLASETGCVVMVSP
jgi:histidine ammonia-lyase